jgi:hypothetical protein
VWAARAVSLGLAVAALATGAVRADDVEALRRQVEAQSELIRRQSEALERQSDEMRQMGDRLRMVEDEQLAAKRAAPPVAAAAPADGAVDHRPGSGLPVAESEAGSLLMSFYASARYLNQRSLDDEYTDSFGVTSDLDLRQDIQFQKVLIYFRGWALDPKLRYLLYAWTSNTSQGLTSQVLIAGKFEYDVAEWLTLGAGTNSLPGVRSTAGGFPNWLSVDARLIADEYFRPSYTFGVWAQGKVLETFGYQLMLGNNLSQLGIDAGQLDAGLNTVSGEITWEPLGEYGRGFGDFEMHESWVTRLGVHFTRSEETSQGQVNTDAFDNVQIRISDGNVIFEPGLFAPGIQIQNATYQMFAVDAGIKYRGLALEGEYYYRWIDDFDGPGTGLLDFDRLYDHGFQLQASAMLLPETLQVYVSGSKIFGGYGDPWDARVGVNWFPFRNRSFRWNNEVMYVADSPVGALSLPYQVGARGPIFLSTLELNF